MNKQMVFVSCGVDLGLDPKTGEQLYELHPLRLVQGASRTAAQGAASPPSCAADTVRAAGKPC